MNKLILAMTLVGSLSAQAVFVKSAKLDAAKANILVDISYGGCGTPKFKLKLQGCYESMPVQCDAIITQVAGNDGCERLNIGTARFNIVDNGLSGDYYGKGLLIIIGEKNFETGKPTTASVRLP